MQIGYLDTVSESEVKRNTIKLLLLKQFLMCENKMSLQLNQFITEKDLKEAFSTEIALHIFLCTAVTNCSVERSSSTLKRIKDIYAPY